MQRAAAFRAALDEHLAAIQARDAARFAATLGDDVIVVDGAGNVVRGTDAVLASHAAWFAIPERWSFAYEVRAVRESEGLGLALLDVTYRHTAESAPSRFLLSLVFERDRNGRYRFVYDQNTPLPDAKPTGG